MQFTVEQFSKANNVEKPVAYGFLRYLAEKGLATTTKATKPENQRGKPAVIYHIEASVATSFNVKEFVETPVQTVAEATSGTWFEENFSL
jgi:hypothetical protein